MTKRTSSENGWRYDVALSFAGEKRDFVKEVNHYLKHFDINSFYDEESAEKWGNEDLRTSILEAYTDSLFVAAFVSSEYLEKKWTKLELDCALTRNKEIDYNCLIVVNFDGVRHPAIGENIRSFNADKLSAFEIACEIKQKVFKV